MLLFITLQVNNVASGTVHKTIATGTHHENHKILSSKESKPKLDTSTNPFDLAFSKSDSACRTKMTVLQSHNNTLNMALRSEGLSQSSPSVEEEDDEATPVVQMSYQDAVLLSATTQHEEDCITLEAASTTVTNNDVLNNAQNITCTSTSVMISKSYSASDLDNDLSNDFVHSEIRTEKSTISSARCSDTSVGGLHLDMLSCDNYDSTDAASCPTSEDEDEPRSKPPVAETPLDVDGPLPSKFHNIPQFSEAREFLGRIPTFAEYMAYRVDKISMDLESRYPELEKHIQQIISTLGNTLTYELFHKAAMNVHSQATQVYEGIFMVLRFGKQLFQNFPENASNFTTQWVNEYIIHQGGWVSLKITRETC